MLHILAFSSTKNSCSELIITHQNHGTQNSPEFNLYFLFLDLWMAALRKKIGTNFRPAAVKKVASDFSFHHHEVHFKAS